MIDISGPVEILIAILSLILLVGTAVAVVRASLATAQVEALRGDRDDLLTRVKILETNNEELQRGLAEERRARQVLENVVTGRDELKQILTLITNHDNRVDRFFIELSNHDKRVTASHEQIVQEVRQARRAIVDAVKEARRA